MTVLVYKMVSNSQLQIKNWKYVCLYPNTRLVVGVDDDYTTHCLEGYNHGYAYWDTAMVHYERVGVYAELSPDDPEYKCAMLMIL